MCSSDLEKESKSEGERGTKRREIEKEQERNRGERRGASEGE